ncbi:MAG: FeoB-associated Cys-rich membrane protein [Vallitaleaceae bacterium]|nr:FeoB-associated Cys-rich membrane protein [Vallitaleaceae bacterium]
MTTYIVLAVLVVALGAAFLYIRKHKNHKCNGCSGCAYSNECDEIDKK